jgi:hypothetical protein
MKVKDIMTTDLKTSMPDTTVAKAGHLMRDGDCGFLPRSMMECSSAL